MSLRHRISRQDRLQEWYKSYTHCQVWRKHYKQVRKRLIESEKYGSDDKEDIKFWKHELEVTRQNYRSSCEYAKRRYNDANQKLQIVTGETLPSDGHEIDGGVEAPISENSQEDEEQQLGTSEHPYIVIDSSPPSDTQRPAYGEKQ